ncbi:MAG: carboxylesterase/lipase family protein [Acidimicrobiales bacterium]
MSAEVTIECPAGPLRGTRSAGVDSFRAIPYAAPPVGELRFGPPQAALGWDGVLDATRFGPAAAQNASPMEAMLGQNKGLQSEDCLFLNIWTPADDRGARRPVMFWVHGGAFVTGSGSTPWYNGANFARNHDVVVVTINYRLGALGFLHLGELGGERFAGSGNAGILDQAAALGWVRDNIAAFGGDPTNVTIFGESAGAMSVGALLGLPAARGLFQRAILQSGACANVKESDQASAIAARFLSDLGVAPNQVTDLFDIPLPQIMAAQAGMATESGDHLAFEPVVDQAFLPRPPLDVVVEGGLAEVSILTGTTLEEMKLFSVMDPSLADLDEARLRARAARLFPEDRIDAVLAAYGDAANEANARAGRSRATPADIWTAIATDEVFREPAIALAEAHAGHAVANTFMYLFSWSTPVFGGALGSCHALEIPFVFDNLDRPGAGMFTGQGPERQELASAMNQAWASFARSGDPSCELLGPWAAYESGRRSTMVLDAPSRQAQDPRGHLHRLWLK